LLWREKARVSVPLSLPARKRRIERWNGTPEHSACSEDDGLHERGSLRLETARYLRRGTVKGAFVPVDVLPSRT
jgi:hypothetical protein